jgi:hypothetical protein
MFHWNFRDSGRGLAALLRSIVVKLKVVESVILDAEERLINEEVKLILPPKQKSMPIFSL